MYCLSKPALSDPMCWHAPDAHTYAANLEDPSACAYKAPDQWQILPSNTGTKRPSVLPVTAAAKGFAKILQHIQTIRTGSLCIVSSAIYVITILQMQPQPDRLQLL